jgi:hypothetical protein
MSSSDWRLQPLRSFWQGVNWENRAIAPITSNNGKGAQTLSLLMSVRQYFRAISWTGIPEIASTTPEPKLSSNSIDASNETLEDFLEDISQFF